MDSLRRLFSTLGLVLLFLVTQQGMHTHGVSHCTPETGHSQPEKHGSPDAPCELCAAYATHAAGLPGKPPSFSAATFGAIASAPTPPHRHAVVRWYSSRAPPFLVA